MPDHEDIGLIAQRLEELHQEIRKGELTIFETVQEVVQAIDFYRKFKKQFAAACFDVTVIARNGDVEPREVPFDWKSLDA